MRYQVDVVDRNTGQDHVILVEASDESNALQSALDAGWITGEVRPCPQASPRLGARPIVAAGVVSLLTSLAVNLILAGSRTSPRDPQPTISFTDSALAEVRRQLAATADRLVRAELVANQLKQADDAFAGRLNKVETTTSTRRLFPESFALESFAIESRLIDVETQLQVLIPGYRSVAEDAIRTAQDSLNEWVTTQAREMRNLEVRIADAKAEAHQAQRDLDELKAILRIEFNMFIP
jgi:hypothetical protein